MFRTYPICTADHKHRNGESLREILRRVEQEIAAEPARAARRRPVLAGSHRGAFAP
jgi:hypothetical protein